MRVVRWIVFIAGLLLLLTAGGCGLELSSKPTRSSSDSILLLGIVASMLLPAMYMLWWVFHSSEREAGSQLSPGRLLGGLFAGMVGTFAGGCSLGASAFLLGEPKVFGILFVTGLLPCVIGLTIAVLVLKT